MPHFPDQETFSELTRDFQLIPVYRRLLGDGLTPVSAFHRLDDGGSACLFESVIGGEKVGRYSFLAVRPFMEFQAHQKRVTGPQDGQTEQLDVENPLEELRGRITALRAASLDDLPPFTGGAVGYAGYDVVRYE